MKKQYLAIIAGGMLLSSVVLKAEDKKTAVEERDAKIGQMVLAMDNLAKFADVLKEEENGAKEIKKYLDENKEEMKKLKLEKLVSLEEAKIEKSRKALKKAMKEVKNSIKLRKALLKAKSGQSFYSKIQGIYQPSKPTTFWQIQQGFMQYQTMDREEFIETKEELLKEPQWSIEVNQDGEVEFSDELSSVTCTVDADGKSDQDQQQKAAWQQPGRNITPSSVGITVDDLDDEGKKKYKVEFGVIVVKIKDDSIGEEAGVKKDDIITHVDGNQIKAKKDYKNAIKDAITEGTSSLKIKRGDKTITVELEFNTQ